ncbi:hypothetical protein [Microbacterium hydrocarbonoxydans]|uniref:hypothetical protein n=1 Tax=Microbacterium hydrocarbonoxydans TaxID=273678 RepID=UPI00204074C8|nr:hypothetical protein [Microbacterium hydrocarbonoxydans]MCM3778815.1 hypothetical protein [Microbacterium hydrocarbonoxydans]
MSYRSHRAGLVVVRVVLPCWTLLIGAFLLWFGITLHSRASGEAWVIIGLSVVVIAASIVTLWWLNRRRPVARSRARSRATDGG